MESSCEPAYLQYKWKSGRLRRGWQYAYCQLHGQFLYLLSSDDPSKRKQKAVVPLAGCTTRIVAHHERLHCFELTHEDRRGIIIDTRAAGTLHSWVTSIAKIAVGPLNAPVQFGLYLEVLGLPPPPRKVSLDEVRRAYRESYVRATKHAASAAGQDGAAALNSTQMDEALSMLTTAYEVVAAVKQAEEDEHECFTQRTLTFDRYAVGAGGGAATSISGGDPLGKGASVCWLGMRLQQVGTPPLARLVVTAGGGAYASGVEINSQADAHGVQEGDILAEVDGRGVRGEALANLAPLMRRRKTSVGGRKMSGKPTIQMIFLRRIQQDDSTTASIKNTPGFASSPNPPRRAAARSVARSIDSVAEEEAEEEEESEEEESEEPEEEEEEEEPDKNDHIDAPITYMGYLERKDQGGAFNVLRKSWKRSYYVLRGAFVYAYKDEQAFKRSTASRGQRGLLHVVPLKDVITQLTEHDVKEHCFELLHEERRAILFSAASEEQKYEWVRAVATASVGPVNAPPTVGQFYEVLGLGEKYEAAQRALNTELEAARGAVGGSNANDDERKKAAVEATRLAQAAAPMPTMHEVKKAYRKAALRSHPDKGGNMDQFKAVTEAYEVLQSIIETEEEEQMHFEELRVVIERDELGLGIGMQQKGEPPLIRVVIDEIIPDGPAERGGVLGVDDVLIEVNGAGVRGLSFEAICEHLKLAASCPVTEMVFLRRKESDASSFDGPHGSTAMPGPATPGRRSSTAEAAAADAAAAAHLRERREGQPGPDDGAPDPITLSFGDFVNGSEDAGAQPAQSPKRRSRGSRRASFFSQVQDEILGESAHESGDVAQPQQKRPSRPSIGRRASWIDRSELAGVGAEHEMQPPEDEPAASPNDGDANLLQEPFSLRAALGLDKVGTTNTDVETDAQKTASAEPPLPPSAKRAGRRMSWVDRSESLEAMEAAQATVREHDQARAEAEARSEAHQRAKELATTPQQIDLQAQAQMHMEAQAQQLAVAHAEALEHAHKLKREHEMYRRSLKAEAAEPVEATKVADATLPQAREARRTSLLDAGFVAEEALAKKNNAQRPQQMRRLSWIDRVEAEAMEAAQGAIASVPYAVRQPTVASGQPDHTEQGTGSLAGMSRTRDGTWHVAQAAEATNEPDAVAQEVNGSPTLAQARSQGEAHARALQAQAEEEAHAALREATILAEAQLAHEGQQREHAAESLAAAEAAQHAAVQARQAENRGDMKRFAAHSAIRAARRNSIGSAAWVEAKKREQEEAQARARQEAADAQASALAEQAAAEAEAKAAQEAAEMEQAAAHAEMLAAETELLRQQQQRQELQQQEQQRERELQEATMEQEAHQEQTRREQELELQRRRAQAQQGEQQVLTSAEQEAPPRPPSHLQGDAALMWAVNRAEEEEAQQRAAAAQEAQRQFEAERRAETQRRDRQAKAQVEAQRQDDAAQDDDEPTEQVHMEKGSRVVYLHQDGRKEVVTVVKSHSMNEGGGYTIFVPSLNRERQTVADRVLGATAKSLAAGRAGGRGSGRGRGRGRGRGNSRNNAYLQRLKATSGHRKRDAKDPFAGVGAAYRSLASTNDTAHANQSKLQGRMTEQSRRQKKGTGSKARRRQSFDSRGLGAETGSVAQATTPSSMAILQEVANAERLLSASVLCCSAESPATGQFAANLASTSDSASLGRNDWVAAYTSHGDQRREQHWVVFDLGRAPAVAAVSLGLWGSDGNPRICKLECAAPRDTRRSINFGSAIGATLDSMDSAHDPGASVSQSSLALLRIGSWEHVASFTVPSAQSVSWRQTLPKRRRRQYWRLVIVDNFGAPWGTGLKSVQFEAAPPPILDTTSRLSASPTRGASPRARKLKRGPSSGSPTSASASPGNVFSTRYGYGREASRATLADDDDDMVPGMQVAFRAAAARARSPARSQAKAKQPWERSLRKSKTPPNVRQDKTLVMDPEAAEIANAAAWTLLSSPNYARQKAKQDMHSEREERLAALNARIAGSRSKMKKRADTECRLRRVHTSGRTMLHHVSR